MIQRTGFGLAIAALICFTATPASAAISLYLDIDSIRGDALSPTHKDWIEIENFGINVTRTIGSSTGGHDREPGSPSISDLMLFKWTDKASIHLFSAVVTGEDLGKVTLDLVKPGTRDDEIVFAQWIFDDVLVSSFQTSGSSGGMPSESLSLNFSKVTYRYTEFDDKGTPKGTAEAFWDLKFNKQTMMVVGDVQNFALHTGTLPEPATGMLMLGGAMLLWRRRRQAA